MAVIDFMGFRVLAMTLLPINKSTLVYGSDSGGRIANAADVRLNKLMEKAAKYMNLAGHYVGSNQGAPHPVGANIVCWLTFFFLLSLHSRARGH